MRGVCLHGDGIEQFECALLFGVGGGEQVEGNGTVILVLSLTRGAINNVSSTTRKLL